MSDFKRERRYEVIKLKTGKPVECLVIESDWPEYELVWQMIQDRMEGRPNELDRLRALTQQQAEVIARLEMQCNDHEMAVSCLEGEVAELVGYAKGLRDALEGMYLSDDQVGAAAANAILAKPMPKAMKGE